jgi:hypothetical protein
VNFIRKAPDKKAHMLCEQGSQMAKAETVEGKGPVRSDWEAEADLT